MDNNLSIVLRNTISNGHTHELPSLFEWATANHVALDGKFFNQSYWPKTSEEKYDALFSILGLAAFHGQVEIIRYLFFFFGDKVDINYQDEKGNTALHLCVIGNIEINDRTSGHHDTIEALLGYGANALLKNRQNKTAQQLINQSIDNSSPPDPIQQWVNHFFGSPPPDPILLHQQKIKSTLQMATHKRLNKSRNEMDVSNITKNFENFCIIYGLKNYILGQSLGYGFSSPEKLFFEITQSSQELKEFLKKMVMKYIKPHIQTTAPKEPNLYKTLPELLSSVLESSTLSQFHFPEFIASPLGNKVKTEEQTNTKKAQSIKAVGTIRFIRSSNNEPCIQDEITNHIPFQTQLK